jgi:hypothetical protein
MVEAVVDHLEVDIVGSEDMVVDQDELLDMEVAQVDHHLEVGIVEAQEDLQVEDIVADHLLSEDDHRVDIRVDQVDHHLEVGIVEALVVAVEEDTRVDHHHEMVDDTLVVVLLAVALPEEVDIVDLPEGVQAEAIRKIAHLARVSEDIATIVIAMDDLEVKHSKKEAKASF